MFGVSRATACNTVAEVSFLIASKMKNQYINMPTTENDILNAKVLFNRIGTFPLVIGAIDGTYIRIKSLGGNNAELYRNRKGYFSINCQAVVSAEVIDFYIFKNL